MEGLSGQLRKGAWTAEEDGLLRQCIEKYGEGKWHQVPLRAGLYRCSKSCRERWCNYLKPSLKRGKLNSDEADLVHRLHKLLGNRWSLIAGRLSGRTANDVKNYWKTQETCCKRKMKEREITCSASSSAQKLGIVKPRSQSCNDDNQLNGQTEVALGEVSNQEDEDKYEFLNNLMDGESMWWENLLEDSQEAYAANRIHEADNSLTSSISSIFDVDQIWSLFSSDTREDT